MFRKSRGVFVVILAALAAATVSAQEIDLIELAAKAQWKNGAGKTLIFGRDQQADGTVKYENDAALEDGKRYARVLFTCPQWQAQGRTYGTFIDVTIPENKPKLVIGGGFNQGAEGTDGVRFLVNFVPAGTTPTAAQGRTRVRQGGEAAETAVNLCVLDVKYTRVIKTKECDLTQYAGQSGSLILLVEAGASADNDWAVWTEARIFGEEAPKTTTRPQREEEEYPKAIKDIKGHASRIYFCDFSADGKLLITASGDRTARLWDVPSGRSAGVLRGHSAHVFQARLAPQGGRVVTASGDKTARIWQTKGGNVLEVLSGHTREVLTAAFSPDSGRLATGGNDGLLKIWQPSGQEIRTVQVASGGVYCLDWHPNGRLIAVGSTNGKLEIYNADTGNVVRTLGGHRRAVNSIAFSWNGQQLVSTSVDNTAKVWETGSGAMVRNYGGRAFYSAVFSPNDKFIVTGNDGRAIIWEVASGKRVLELPHASGSPVRGVCVHPGGKYIVSGGDDNVARIWQLSK